MKPPSKPKRLRFAELPGFWTCGCVCRAQVWGGTAAPHPSPLPGPMYLVTWLLICILCNIPYDKTVRLSVSLSSVSHRSKLAEFEVGAVGTSICSCLVRSMHDKLLLAFGLWRGTGQSRGTELLACGIWHCLQVLSKSSWITGPPVDACWCVRGACGETHTRFRDKRWNVVSNVTIGRTVWFYPFLRQTK